MNKHYLLVIYIAATILSLTFLSGCYGPSPDRIQRAKQEKEALTKKRIEWNTLQESACQKIIAEHGEKLFNKDYDLVFNSIIKALSIEQCSVSTVAKDAGYIAASGFLFRDAELQILSDDRIAEANRINKATWEEYGFDNWPNATDVPLEYMTVPAFQASKFNILVTQEKNNQVKVKMTFIYNDSGAHARYVEANYVKFWKIINERITLDEKQQNKH